jgi:hypothetical protein
MHFQSPPFWRLMTTFRVFQTNKHNRVLFSKFVQGAPPKDMHGLNKHKIHIKRNVRAQLYNFPKRGVPNKTSRIK